MGLNPVVNICLQWTLDLTVSSMQTSYAACLVRFVKLTCRVDQVGSVVRQVEPPNTTPPRHVL